MKRLVKLVGGSVHKTESFSYKNYVVDSDNNIIDDIGTVHHLYGTELFLYSTSNSFYVYTKSEVIDIRDALEIEIDGIPTIEQSKMLETLYEIIN